MDRREISRIPRSFRDPWWTGRPIDTCSVPEPPIHCHRCGQNDHIASACQSGVVDAVDRLRRELRDDMNEVRGLFQEMQQRMESQQQLEQERWDYVLSEVAALRVRSAPRVPAQLQHQRRMKALKRKRAEEEKKNEEEEEEQKKKEGDKEKQDGA